MRRIHTDSQGPDIRISRASLEGERAPRAKELALHGQELARALALLAACRWHHRLRGRATVGLG